MATSADAFACLVERVRRGDATALAELMQQYEPEIRRAARALLGRALRPHLDSADLVQSIHHALLLGIRQEKIQLDSPQQLLGLTLTMVRRKVAHHWRKLQRQQRLELDDTETQPLAELHTASPEDDPARAAQVHDAVAHLARHLDERDRQLVELRLQGYSTVEVARRLGLDADVLRVRLSRLRRRLREMNLLTEWL